MKPITIKFFRAYSKEAENLKEMLEDSLVNFLSRQLGVESSLTICESKGFPDSSLQMLSAAFNNEIVIIDGSIEEAEGYELGINYECITPVVSSLDNILIVSRTQLPLNLIACRSNVASLGENDTLYPINNKGGYIKSYTNEHIQSWLFKELKSMNLNNRLHRNKVPIIDMNLPVSELMKKEMEVMDENSRALAKEKVKLDSKGKPKKKIFISYRTQYYSTEESKENATTKKDESKYKNKYSIKDVAEKIQEYHIKKGDADEWEDPFYYPSGVLSNEFMPEIRRWAFVSIPDRKIRECDEFWIFDTKYHPEDENGQNGEVGYWDSWWCLGEFLTIVRMKHDGQLVADEKGQYHKKEWTALDQVRESPDRKVNENVFRIMIFNPDKEDPIKDSIEDPIELSIDKIPRITEDQNRELSRYFANGDFLESGLETMAGMRKKRNWTKWLRYPFFLLMKKFVWPNVGIGDDFKDYPFEYFEESIWSHVYDESFVNNRLLTCPSCTPKGKTLDDILNDSNLIWNFLNINNYYSDRHLHGVKRQDGIVQLNDDELKRCQIGDEIYKIVCDHHHDMIIKKSSDKFFIYWAPRRGKRTGPNDSMIETVDLYELV